MTTRIAAENSRVVSPQDIFFTQDSISITFKKPRDQERIDDAAELIIQGKLSPRAFPRINVVDFQNQLWSLDNRRLWVFKKAEVNFITVTIVSYDFNARFNTLATTSPFLYSTMSSPGFFPRVRGHCKDLERVRCNNINASDPSPLPPLESPQIQVRPSVPSPPKASKPLFPATTPPAKSAKPPKNKSPPPSAKLSKPSKYKDKIFEPDVLLSLFKKRSSDIPPAKALNTESPPPSAKVQSKFTKFKDWIFGPEHMHLFLNKRRSDVPSAKDPKTKSPPSATKVSKSSKGKDWHFVDEHVHSLPKKRNSEVPPAKTLQTKSPPTKVSKSSKSKDWIVEPEHVHSLPNKRSSDVLPLDLPRKHSSALPPLPKRDLYYGSLNPNSKKRPHEPSRELRDLECSPAKKSRAPPVGKKPNVPSSAKKPKAPSPLKKSTASSPTEKPKAPSVLKKSTASSPMKKPKAPSVPKKSTASSPTENLKAPSLLKKSTASSPTKNPKAPSPVKKSTASSPTQKPKALSQPKDSRSLSAVKKPKAVSPLHTVSATYTARKGLPPNGTIKSKVKNLSPDRQSSSLVDAEKLSAALRNSSSPKAKGEPSSIKAKTSKSRPRSPDVAAPIAKRSKPYKPPSKPKPFSYDFHSIRTKPKPPTTKKVPASASTKPSSQHLENSDPYRIIRSFASPDEPQVPPSLEETTTSNRKSPTKQTMPEDFVRSDLPSAPNSPRLTCSPKKKLSEKTDRQHYFSNFGTPLYSDPPRGPQFPYLGTWKSTTQPTIDRRQDSSGLLNPTPPAEKRLLLRTQISRDPSKEDMQATVEPEPCFPRTPCQESTSKAKHAFSHAEWLPTETCPPPTANPMLAMSSALRELEETVSPLSLLPSETPINTELIVRTQQPQEFQKMSEQGNIFMVECPVEYDTKGQLFDKMLGSLLGNSAIYYPGGLDVRRSAGIVDVAMTVGLERPELQQQLSEPAVPPVSDMQVVSLAPPIRRSEIQETELAIRGTVSNQQNVVPQQQIVVHSGRPKARGRGFSEVAGLGLNIYPDVTVCRNSNSGVEIQEINRPNTRSRYKKKKEKRSKSHPRTSSKEKPRSAPESASTQIVLADTRKSKYRCSDATTIKAGDMVYVNINEEVAESGTEGLEGSTGSSGRLHPRLRVIGPFEVIRKVNAYSVRLKLPRDCLMKPVFSLTVLKKSLSPFDELTPHKGVPMRLVPETILHKRIAGRVRKQKVFNYLVKWKKLPASEATWEPETIFDEHPHLANQIDFSLFPSPFLLRNLRA